MIHGVLINEKDNVVTAVAALSAGQKVFFYGKNGELRSVFVKDDIPVFHKFALTDIKQDAPIIKYGEHIGFAASNINKGQHVHVHNVYSKRENLKNKSL